MQKYLNNSLKRVTIFDFSNGNYGLHNNTLQSPANILLDSQEGVYITDGYKNRVQILNS